jgi:hypothetical protein
VILNTLLIACVGLTMEIIFTAALTRKQSGDWRLKGYTYVWMLPIYATVYPFFSIIYPKMAFMPLLARGVIYVAVIYLVEYTSGWALRLSTGECPWERDYRGNRWAVHDLIRLDFAPAWFLAAMIFETLCRALGAA